MHLKDAYIGQYVIYNRDENDGGWVTSVNPPVVTNSHGSQCRWGFGGWEPSKSEPDKLIPFRSINQLKVGMRIVPVPGNEYELYGPGEIITISGVNFVVRHDKCGSTITYNSPESFFVPQAPPTLKSVQDVSESAKLYTFFATPLSDNTCKCGAPKPCAYHP